MQRPDGFTETKLAGKWKGAGEADLISLMQLLHKTALRDGLKDTLADRLIGAGRYLGIADDDLYDALFGDENSQPPCPHCQAQNGWLAQGVWTCHNCGHSWDA